jgi:hypothetical protein
MTLKKIILILNKNVKVSIMKIYLLFLFLLLLSCELHEAVDEPAPESIALKTEKDAYKTKDSIRIFLNNNSEHVLMLGYRCSRKNLEMFYQQKENNKWSENKWFSYMNMKCMTIPSKVKKYSVLKHTFPSAEFNGTGTFRLLLSVFIPDKDSSIVVVSNSFVIE